MASSYSHEHLLTTALHAHRSLLDDFERQLDALSEIARAMTASLHSGGQILWCGNGGSAGDSQHLAAEIVGRFRRERRALASLALTTDSSVLTSIANDYGYESVFARQIQAIGRPNDLLVGISTSGNSPNIVCALETARSLGLTTVAFTSLDGGCLRPLADYLFAVGSSDTPRIQEMHMLAGHLLCDWIEADWINFETRRACGSERVRSSGEGLRA